MQTNSLERRGLQSQALGPFRAGDLVATRVGYPTLYEVLSVDRDGVLRVRGLNWQPGYSANISVAEVRPVTRSLADHSRPSS
jgi:hypothetical protein